LLDREVASPASGRLAWVKINPRRFTSAMAPALYATTSRRLGGPASHGCVSLHPSHAAMLFSLVEHEGARKTRIEISN